MPALTLVEPDRSQFQVISLIGNLTRDPELRTTPSGTSVSDLRLAINRPKKNGEDQGADYVDVVCWGVTAENCAKYLSKGRPVAVSGRLRHSEWETDGARRSKLEVVADQIDFLHASSTSATPSETQAPAEEVATS
jgi:single-strand DNA-binding protein